MTRVFIDMRMCYSYHMIASMAGACDLDVVILSARECRSDKVIRAIRQDLRRNSSISKSSVLSIPCRTVDAIEVVREAARSNDIIVTDSSPLAFEFLRKVGTAVNNWGEEYTDLNIFDKLDDFYRCKALQQQGINPYKPRRFKSADRRRLQQKLEELIFTVCGKVPRESAIQQSHLEECVSTRISAGASPACAPRVDARVYVDGDSCPVAPEIIEACGDAHVPITYVSNRDATNLVNKARQKDPWLMGGVKCLPEITFETVPVVKDSADMLIVNKIAPADIVVTDDAALAAACLNKGATAISFSGCVMERVTCDARVSRREVADRKRAWRKKRRRKSQQRSFAESFRRLVRGCSLDVGDHEAYKAS